MTIREKPIGVLVGNTGSSILSCVLAGSHLVKRGEFLRIPHKESEETDLSWVICRVYKITRSSSLFSEDIVDTSSLGGARYFPESVSDDIMAKLEIMGFVNPSTKSLTHTRLPLKPGARVYKVTRDLITRVIGFNPGTSIELGRLVGYERESEAIPVLLDINSLVTEHLAILAMTGAGKSYAVGRITELLLAHANARILIFDPHGEYGNCLTGGSIRPTNTELIVDNSYRLEAKSTIERIQNLNKQGGGLQSFAPDSLAAEKKYGVGNFTPLRIRLDRLPEDALKSLIPELTEPQHRVLGVALKRWFDEFPEPRNPLDLVKLLTSRFSDLKEKIDDETGAKGALSSRSASIVGLRLKEMIEDTNLFYIGIGKPTTIEDILGTTSKTTRNLGRISIIDLMSMPNEHAQVAVSVILGELLDKSKKEKTSIPETFTILEEAHNFIPRTSRPISKDIITKVASEGRKFGLGVCVVSQRPSRLDPDVLSQCNSFIILRIKNPQDRSFVESVAEYASKTDLENIPALSTGEGLVFGKAFPFTVLAKIGPRAIAHGGVTPDVIASWRKN